jgi:hypothetical protein
MEVSGQFQAPAALPVRVRAPGTHCIGGWVGPRAVLEVVVKRKIPSPRQKSNTRTPIVQSVVKRYSDWAITALTIRIAKSETQAVNFSYLHMRLLKSFAYHFLLPHTMIFFYSESTVWDASRLLEHRNRRFESGSRHGTYKCVSKIFRTGRLERELQMVQLSAIKCSRIAILWVSLVRFAAITLCVISQRVFVFISLSTQSGNFWIYPRTSVSFCMILSGAGREKYIWNFCRKLWRERDYLQDLGTDEK